MIKLLTVADLITLLNAVLGFIAILFAMSHQFSLAASLILLGLLADGLDGMVARRLGIGKIGEFLEPIADMISLSVAPLILWYAIYYNTIVGTPWVHGCVGLVMTFSLICSIIRLSSFSLLKEQQYFVGLPTSASAMFLVAISYLAPAIWYPLGGIIILSLAMISSIHFPKLGLIANLVTALLVAATIIFDSMYYNITPIVLLAALGCYVILGPLYFFLKTRQVSGTGDIRN